MNDTATQYTTIYLLQPIIAGVTITHQRHTFPIFEVVHDVSSTPTMLVFRINHEDWNACRHWTILNQVMIYRLMLLAVQYREWRTISAKQQTGHYPIHLQIVERFYLVTYTLMPVIDCWRSEYQAILFHLLYLPVKRMMKDILITL